MIWPEETSGLSMKSCTNPRFWKAYARLTAETQRRARKAYKLWSADPEHSSLHFKKLKNVDLWSVRVDDNHRALANVRSDTAYWIWIGSHEEYEEIIASKR